MHRDITIDQISFKSYPARQFEKNGFEKNAFKVLETKT